MISTLPASSSARDWNTQRESLLFYEGSVWYKRPSITQNPKEQAVSTFWSVQITFRRLSEWRRACEHEGGFTPLTSKLRGA